ncbi:TonB-dependent receptor [Steroidobacter sp. S1-65]|uniref:TonB-dependent receptor n=1 Tax=Steroidobacter gossypii TaxID=2805490 RepID=A0ABS1WRV0_9GAMM|nr:TonB-dependent receptor [Steroidobacter gossypii]MBM0103706.1 TonB-dependent receptor [Steroidobacter gossypii]
MNKHNVVILGAVAFALGLVMTPRVAAAATPAEADQKLIAEIIVTAQKRATALQDVPFSVAAASEEQIRNSGSANIVELSRNFAGLTITDLGPGQSQVAIRGISAGQVVRDQPGVKESVGVYLDESAISVALFTPDLDLFDLERFEVLRGPQGTLFGAGSSAGTVRYITRQPQLGEFEGAVEVGGYTGTDTDWGGGIKGMINAPMGQTTALRLVGYYNEMAGFIDSYYPGRAVREDVNSGEKSGARVALLIQPSETISITPRIVYQKLETDGYPRIDVYNILGNPFTTEQPPVNPGERGQVTQIREGIDDEFTLADLKLEFGLGGLTLTSISSYTDRDVVVLRDASQLTGSVTLSLDDGRGIATPADVRLNSPLYDTTSLKSFSQELRLASDGGGAFEWLVGAFYQDIDRDYGQNLPTPGYDDLLTRLGRRTSVGYNAPPNTPYFSQVPYDFQQFALFGEGTWHFNEQWSLTGGLRYYDFEEERFLTFAGVFADVGYTRQPGETSSDGFSPRVILSFEPNEDILLTAQVARGFRLGGINDPLNVELCGDDDLITYSGQPTFDDEKVLNYELGAKTLLADRRITFNAAVFYSDIDDLQVIADAGSCSSRIVLNAQAEAVGAELELFARPDEHWDLGVSATYVQAEITETRLSAIGQPIAGIIDGNRLPTSPEFQAAASATYNWALSNTLEGFVNLTFQVVGSSYTQLADQEPPTGCVGCPGAPGFFMFGAPTITQFTYDPELPSYELGNLRFGVRSGSWEAAAFVNNLWDERAFLSLDRERGTRARVGYLTNMPRTYGVSLRMDF